jgi:hypothetical protein
VPDSSLSLRYPLAYLWLTRIGIQTTHSLLITLRLSLIPLLPLSNIPTKQPTAPQAHSKATCLPDLRTPDSHVRHLVSDTYILSDKHKSNCSIGRDKSKAKATRDSLGGSPPSESSHFLDTIAHIQQTNLSPSPEIIREAIELLELEASKSSPDSGLPCDIPIFQFWLTKTPQYISERLQALYYRGRIQSTLLDTLTVLIQRGFITLDSLRKPIALWTGSDAVSTITDLLTTFDALAKEVQFDVDNKKPHPLWESYTMFEATNWLSTLIARSCADVATLFETIEVSNYLGGRNKAAFERYQEKSPNKRFDCNADERATADGTTPMNYFGFWLPRGLGNKSEHEIRLEIMSCVKRFDNIERVYKSFFDIPDDALLRPDQQAK